MRYSKFITVEEMGEYLNIGRSKAYELCRQPGFPKLTIGRLIRIPYEGLNEWISSNIE